MLVDYDSCDEFTDMLINFLCGDDLEGEKDDLDSDLEDDCFTF